MRKTFCDRHPDTECTSRVGRLHLSVIHQTNKREVVSEDEYRTLEICGGCIDELLAGFLAGTAPLPMMKEPGYPGEDAIMADTPLPFPRADSPERIAAIAQERALVTGYPVGPRDE